MYESHSLFLPKESPISGAVTMQDQSIPYFKTTGMCQGQNYIAIAYPDPAPYGCNSFVARQIGFPNGNYLQETFHNDQPHGVQNLYSSNGKVIGTRYFWEGAELSHFDYWRQKNFGSLDLMGTNGADIFTMLPEVLPALAKQNELSLDDILAARNSQPAFVPVALVN